MKIQEFEAIDKVAKIFGAECCAGERSYGNKVACVSFKDENSDTSVRLFFTEHSSLQVMIGNILDCYFHQYENMMIVYCYPCDPHSFQDKELLVSCGGVGPPHHRGFQIGESNFFIFLDKYMQSKQKASA